MTVVPLSAIYAELNAITRTRGGQAELARKIGVSEAYVSQIVNGHKAMTGAVVAALGFRRVEMFERVK